MSWTQSGEYLQLLSASLGQGWLPGGVLQPSSSHCFGVCPSAIFFCCSSTPVPASPASLHSRTFSGLVGNAATSFASSLSLLPVPGCLQTYVLVPSDLHVCVEQKGQSGWCHKRILRATLTPGRACCQRRAMRVFTVQGCPFFLQLQHQLCLQTVTHICKE